MASAADHIFIGSVINVEMIDSEGRQIDDLNVMTGPGSKNLIRLQVKVEKVLVSSGKNVPNTLYIPLDPFLHFSLGQIKEAESHHSNSRLFFLKGAEFLPIKTGVFARNLSDKKEAIRIYRATHK
ncbi:hypothetical protein [Undibacterium sp. Ji22W]|uniref:hypothetical protein n=1 Tax=Undibacterium sp. Ji22W TaxID=3413038 RepID=UPI003BF3A356